LLQAGVPLYVEVDQIYNLACPASPIHYQRDPVQTIKTSVHGAINMLGLAKRTKAKILQASTSEVYGDPQVHPQTEDYWGHVNPIGPRSCYDEGKRAAETLFFDYHRQHKLRIKVARIFNTYGPRMHPDDGRVVSTFIVQALAGEPPHRLRRRRPDPLLLLRRRPHRRPDAHDGPESGIRADQYRQPG
jgi:UDP-glucuronate decarboxylase